MPPEPHTRVRKRARGLSGSPDRTHKKTLDENGVVRETVKDIPNSARKRFFKIWYVPGKIDDLEVPKTPFLTVSQQAELKKKMLSKMTGDQAKRWHEGRNSHLNAKKLKGRCSWVNQAVESQHALGVWDYQASHLAPDSRRYYKRHLPDQSKCGSRSDGSPTFTMTT